MPGTVAESSQPASANMANENKNSVKILDELMAKLNLSKAQEDVNAATLNLATFINGPIEEHDAPTK